MISFVLSSLRLSGGVQVVVEYANRLAARGHHVSLVAPRSTGDPEITRSIAPTVQVCESRRPLNAQSGGPGQLRLAWSLAQAIPCSEVVVATHTPTIVPVCLATLRHRPRRAWLYMDYAEMFQARPIESWLLAHGPRWFDRVATLSRAGCDDALRAGARHATVIGLGISDEQYFVPQTRAENPHPIALYLGDARPRKGLAEFLAAAQLAQRSIPDLHLLMVTKDQPVIDTAVPYEHLVRPDRSSLPDLYRRADVFVSASWGEGFGLPPLEAMACGTPVVLTDSRGVRDYARPNENCLLVQPHDSGQLAAAMVRLLTERPLARKMAQAGVTMAAQFQWDACVDRLEAVLRR
jgi:glycosyltransferase involved in cell wall biosynthesis